MSEIASDYLNNEDDLSSAGRKIGLKGNLVSEFNNKTPQVNQNVSLSSFIIVTLKFTILLLSFCNLGQLIRDIVTCHIFGTQLPVITQSLHR